VHDVREWVERRVYDYAQFADSFSLAERKRDLGLTVSVLLPCLEATNAVRWLIKEIHALNERAPLVDQIAVIAAKSFYASDAVGPDVEVYSGDELVPEYGPVIGKSDDMWRALAIAHAELVVYADVEAPAFRPHFVLGVLGPLLSVLRVRFTKAAYDKRSFISRRISPNPRVKMLSRS